MKLRDVTPPRKAPLPKTINPSQPGSKKGKSKVTFKDDDPFEEVYDTACSSASDESGVSDFGTRRRRRRRRRSAHEGRRQKEKEQARKLSKLRHKPAPEAPELSDDEDSYDGPEGDNDDDADSAGPPSDSSSDEGDENAATKGGSDLLMKLPGELRLRVYMMVLVTDEPVDFSKRSNLARSGQLLRTCRTIAQEAAPVLYGRNSFHFERTHGVRGRYFEAVWGPIGFKDVRRFLLTIGNTNVAHMKHISFLLEDGNKTGDYPDPDVPERLFVNDPILHHVLRVLSENTVLYTLNLFFNGEKPLKRTDYHFLKALSALRAVKVHMPASAPGLRSRSSQIRGQLRDSLVPIMTVQHDDSAAVNPGWIKHQVKMYFGDA